MQTKTTSNYQELKRAICKNYMKNACAYGMDCRYRHPPRQQFQQSEVCTYFLQNKCKRGSECPFLHGKPRQAIEAEVCRYFLQNKCKRQDCPFLHRKAKQEKRPGTDWLTFCSYFLNDGQCRNRECRFLHISEEDKEVYRKSGKINTRLLEQAKCKALLQDVPLDGSNPPCKDYLQSSCEWMTCPLLHITRQEFSQEILRLMTEKFSAVLGPREGYHAYQKSVQNSSARYKETYEYDRAVPLEDRYDRYVPFEKESYRLGHGRKPGGGYPDRTNYDQQEFVSSETDRIIKGVYNLMKRDNPSYVRHPEREDVADLRLKLNKLAEENAQYRYEFSRMHPHDNSYQPLLSTVPGTDDYKYQDAMRRLERENMEMKRQISLLQGRYAGNYGMHEEHTMGGGLRGPAHHPVDKRKYGLPKSMMNHSSYPVKQKVNTHLKQMMQQQYTKPQQYSKVSSYSKHQKPSQPIKKHSQQQSQKPQKDSKGISNQKKKDQGQNSVGAKSVVGQKNANVKTKKDVKKSDKGAESGPPTENGESIHNEEETVDEGEDLNEKDTKVTQLEEETLDETEGSQEKDASEIEPSTVEDEPQERAETTAQEEVVDETSNEGTNEENKKDLSSEPESSVKDPDSDQEALSSDSVEPESKSKD